MKKGYLEHVIELRDRNETLRNLLAAFNERYRCECKHNRCKRCELNRQADELLGGDQ
jgi:hypothetical protein